MNKMQIIGHRGASGLFPENTLEAFQKAIDLGCNGFELDVQMSIDNQLIVIHDETVNRTTNGIEFVNQLTLLELKSLLISDKYQIPTLEEVFEIITTDIFVNIEIKNNLAVEKVIILIEKFIAERSFKYSNFIISSFDWKCLEKVRLLNRNILIGVLTDNNIEGAISFAKIINAKSINPYFRLLNKENVAKIQNESIEIHAWTVNEIADIELMKSLNIDVIITDFPDRILKVI